MKRSTVNLCVCTLFLLVSCAKVTARINNFTQSLRIEPVVKSQMKQTITDEIEDLDNKFYIASRVEKNHPKAIKYKTRMVLKFLELYGIDTTKSYDVFLDAFSEYDYVTTPIYDGFDSIDDTLDISSISYEDYIEIIHSWREFDNNLERQYGRTFTDSLYRYSLNDLYGIGEFNLITLLPSEALTYLDEIMANLSFDQIAKAEKCSHILLNLLNRYNYNLSDTVYFETVSYIADAIESYGFYNNATSFFCDYTNELYDSEDGLEIQYVIIQGDTLSRISRKNLMIEKAMTQLGCYAFHSGETELMFDCLIKIKKLKSDGLELAVGIYFYDVNECVKQLLLLSDYCHSIHEYEDQNKYISYAERIMNESILGYNGLTLNTSTKIEIYNTILGATIDPVLRDSIYSIIEQLEYPRDDVGYAIDKAFNNIINGKFDNAKTLLDHVFVDSVFSTIPLKGKISAIESRIFIAINDKDIDLAHKLSRERLNCIEKDYLDKGLRLTEMTRTKYWLSNYSNTLEISSMFDMLSNEGQADISFDAAILQKRILTKIHSIIKENITNSSDEKLRSLYKDYTNAVMLDTDSLLIKEWELMRLYSSHPDYITGINLSTWKDVQSHLKNREIAIEFATTLDWENSSFILTAIVLKKNDAAPRLIRLCPEYKIKEILNDTKEASGYTSIYDIFESEGNVLYNLIWKPLEFELKGIKTIYYSPYSYLNSINLDAVRKDEKSKYLAEQYNMIRLSSTEDLCEPKMISNTSAVIFGNLDYSESSDTNTVIHNPISVNDDNTDQIAQLRALREEWEPLVQTGIEIEYIQKLMTNNKWNVDVFTQDKGTEKTFKSLSSMPASVIHLATHGFYFDKEFALSINYLENRQYGDVSSSDSRSGIVLSGANKAWKEGIIENNNDGILTSNEIKGVDLSSTDLLVLSACQSGLGELIYRDSNWGIARSFKIAGVNTIIMSLWEVDDEATSKMMQSFYKHYLSGKTKREAFKAAQLEVKRFYEDRAKNQTKSIPKYKRYDSAYYWASFIMLD